MVGEDGAMNPFGLGGIVNVDGLDERTGLEQRMGERITVVCSTAQVNCSAVVTAAVVIESTVTVISSIPSSCRSTATSLMQCTVSVSSPCKNCVGLVLVLHCLCVSSAQPVIVGDSGMI